jgi:hypothetical protein
MKRLLAILSLALLTATSGAYAAAPQYDKKPPGQVVQDVTAYLSGEAMNSAWHVVASRVSVGKQNGKTPAYQWYLSFYAPAQNGLKLTYQIPNSSQLLLSRVQQAHGAQLFFPVQSLKIVGAAEFERSGVQDVVVQTHQFAADCGSSTVAIFGAVGSKVEPRVAVVNGCDLSGAIVKKGALSAVELTGPYYNKTAPMCCPTKPHASAMLSYTNGAWSVKPNYFTISASMISHQ